MLDLPEVTLVCADTANHALALRALARCRAGIRFGRSVLLTDALPPGCVAEPGIDVVAIPPLRSRDDYSQLMLKGLREHVATSHVLVVQWDGYVVNAPAWDARFLDCDYLGAKWFWFRDGHDVGNGGFSLRSKRLLDALADPRIALVEAEDLTIGRTFRPLLETEHGIRFGTAEQADRFAFEAAYPIGRPFGFHGLFNFARVVPELELTALADDFSDAIARSLQLGQLLRNCVAMGQWQAAAALARRRLRASPGDAEAAALLEQATRAASQTPAAGRNDPCPCGSGKRFKQCHGALGGGGTANVASAPSAAARQAPARVHAERGMQLHQRGDVDAAEREYRAALALDAGDPLALHYLGVVEYQRGRLGAALPLLQRAAAAVPQEAEFHNNLGLALVAAGHLQDGVDAYRRALSLRPSHAGAWNNLGLALAALRDLQGAADAHATALDAQPEFPAAHWNRALALLAMGRHEEGWREYEWRLAIPGFAPVESPPPSPRWHGEPFAGRRLLVRAEQGLGDALQFVRFARTLAERGIVVVMRVPRKLMRLVATVPGVAEVSPEGDPWPRCDAETPLQSLPLALGLDDAARTVPVPYVAVDATRRAAAVRALRALSGGRRAAGLAWSGSPRYANDRQRSMPLAAAMPLLLVDDVAWFSLQHDDAQAVAHLPGAERLHRIDARLDFDDMAGMIDALDLVVTVDTSVGHVAGALGKDVWILLPYAADWRWGVEGDRSAWYPTARLFRQPAPGDWDAVIRAVREAFRTRAR